MDQENSPLSPFETSCSQEQGKYAKATRGIEIDEVILEEQPLIIGPSMKQILRGPFPCVGCCKLIPNEESSYKCLCCGWPSCSSTCSGLKEPNRHGLECRILKNGLKRGVRTFYQYFRFDVLTIIRTLCLQLDKKKWNYLLCLEDHLHQIEPTSSKFKEMTEKTTFIVDNFIKPLKEYEEENHDEILLHEKSATLINKIWALIVTNSFVLPPNIVILYKSVNTFEQSCLPNTTQFINNSSCDIILRAVKPIAKGDHVTLMYTSMLLGTISRRRELRGKYLKCFCVRCKDPSELGTFFGALKCVGSKKPCGGVQIPLKPLEENTEWLCSKCKIRLPNEDVMKFVDHLGDEVDKVLKNKPLIHELKVLLKKLKKFLHQNHYHIFRVLLELVKLQDSDETDNKDLEIVKINTKTCSHLIRLIKKLDPALSRLSMDLSSLLLILFNAKWWLMKSSFSKDSKDDCLNEVNLLKSTLEDAKRIVEAEKSDQGRELLLQRIREKEIIFNNWLKDNDFA